MGNLNNPSISRWGINLFWYRYWFKDFFKQLDVQKDIVFETLVYYYIFFGYLYPFNFLKSQRWISNSYFNKKNHIQFNLQYYREIELINKFTKEKIYSTLRIRAANLFYSRFWLLKFHNWIIINFYCYQPLKKKNSIVYSTFLTASVRNKNFSLKLKRFKLLLFYYYNFFNSQHFFLYKF